ncbi:MAG: hypothetical protein DHS20C15_26740 [Planctomycetota bacterium]|nr:MAG: hypothetical protein DHS20C15_26740 [Planctomycetota bacterium]
MPRTTSRPLGRRSFLALSAALLCATSVSAQGALTQREVIDAHVQAGVVGADISSARIAELAEKYGMDALELSAELKRDEDIVISPDNRIVYVDRGLLAAGSANDGDESDNQDTYGISSADAFTLNSRPGANKTLYMDFTGHHSVSNSWGHNIQFPAYDTNGDPNNFSDAERDQIIRWWLYVVEDFAPFDLNVTTQDPGLSALTRNGGGDQTYGTRCVITQPTSGFGDGIGGVAQLYSFNDSIDNPVFAFNKGDNTGSMTVSHEVGHAMGLSHDGLNGASYHPGTGSGSTSWGPIMGAPFSSSLVQWSDGDYSGASTSQNDLAIINGGINNIPYLSDDHGDGFGSGSPMSAAEGCPTPIPARGSGTLGRSFDTDAHTYAHQGGAVVFEAARNDPGGNLDLRLQVFDPAGVMIADVNPNNDANASVDLDVPPGIYTMVVDGVGKSGVYDDYGSVGQYTVSAFPGGPESIVKFGEGVTGFFGVPPSIGVSGLTCPGEPVSLNLLQAAPSSTAFLCVGAAELNVPFKGGVLIPDVTGPGFFVSLPVTFFGSASLNAAWPTGLPSGVSLYFQYWVIDASAVAGFSATQGVRMTQP